MRGRDGVVGDGLGGELEVDEWVLVDVNGECGRVATDADGLDAWLLPLEDSGSSFMIESSLSSGVRGGGDPVSTLCGRGRKLRGVARIFSCELSARLRWKQNHHQPNTI